MDGKVLEKIVESIMEGVYLVDAERRIVYWNRGAERISGFSREEVVGRRCSDNILRHVDAAGTELCLTGCPLSECIGDGMPRETEVFLHHKDGHRVPVAVRVAPLSGESGTSRGAIEIFADRSERSNILEELEELRKEVLTDPLTGLGNRRFLELSLARAYRDLEESGEAFGLLMLDIDRFKLVNDVYGHANGDRALRMVAWTMANAVRRLDQAGRWGGEEFLVIVPGAGPSLLASIAERIRALVERSWLGLEDGREIRLTVSIGAAQARRGEEAESLVARADKALYSCKEAGRNRVLCEDSSPD